MYRCLVIFDKDSPGNVLMIWPRFHLPWGKLSSTTSTRSPVWASVSDLLLHFLRSVTAGTYSRNHLLQKWSVSIWACLHCFLEFKSLSHQRHREVRSGCSFQWGIACMTGAKERRVGGEKCAREREKPLFFSHQSPLPFLSFPLPSQFLTYRLWLDWQNWQIDWQKSKGGYG